MATLWIRQHIDSGVAGAGRPIPLPVEPGTDLTPVTFTTTTQSAAFAASTKYIGIIGSAAFHYVVGANPVATTAAFKVPADWPVHISVTPGHKIAVVAAA